MNNQQIIQDIDLELRVEFGNKKMTVKDVLSINEGTIIELDKNANEPVIIYVNNKAFGEGEVISIVESYGVRLTKIYG